jgi:hypothetical protein
MFMTINNKVYRNEGNLYKFNSINSPPVWIDLYVDNDKNEILSLGGDWKYFVNLNRGADKKIKDEIPAFIFGQKLVGRFKNIIHLGEVDLFLALLRNYALIYRVFENKFLTSKQS